MVHGLTYVSQALTPLAFVDIATAFTRKNAFDQSCPVVDDLAACGESRAICACRTASWVVTKIIAIGATTIGGAWDGDNGTMHAKELLGFVDLRLSYPPP